MPDINYKSKYQELKQKYKNSVDAAFRLGYEQGQNDAQVEQVQQQAADQQAAEEAAQQQGQPGQPGQEGAPQEEQPQDSANPQGTELDQHISTLEGMLGKSELTEKDMDMLRKSIADIKFKADMRKSDQAVKNISKALAPKKAMSQSAQHNLTPKAKAALSAQEQIVGDIMKSWDAEESKVKTSISNIIASEGLKKD